MARTEEAPNPWIGGLRTDSGRRVTARSRPLRTPVYVARLRTTYTQPSALYPSALHKANGLPTMTQREGPDAPTEGTRTDVQSATPPVAADAQRGDGSRRNRHSRRQGGTGRGSREPADGVELRLVWLRGRLEAGFASEAVHFVWQRWNEALDERAPVAVHAPTMGARAILDELLTLRAVSNDAERRGKSGLEAVQQEAFGHGAESYPKTAGVLKVDPVLKVLSESTVDHPSFSRHYALGTAPAEVADSRTDIAARRLARRISTDYQQTVVTALIKAVFEGEPGVNMGPDQTRRVATLTDALITDLLAQGFSPQYLRDQAKLIPVSTAMSWGAEVTSRSDVDPKPQTVGDAGDVRLGNKDAAAEGLASASTTDTSSHGEGSGVKVSLRDGQPTGGASHGLDARPSSVLAAERTRLEGFLASFTRADEPTVVLFTVKASHEFWARWPHQAFDPARPAKPGDVRLPTADADLKALQPRGTTVDGSFRAGTEGVWFVRVDVDARDHIAAAHQAYSLYQRTADLVWAESGEKIPGAALVASQRRSDGNNFVVHRAAEVRLTASTNRLIPGAHLQHRGFARRLAAGTPAARSNSIPRGEAPTRTPDALSSSQAVLPSRLVAARRIADAVRAARIAAEQPYGETSLTTLWTALEVLAHREYHTGIIERVVRSITPILGSRKVRGMTDELGQYLAQYLMRDAPPTRRNAFAERFPDLLTPESKADSKAPLSLDGPMLLGAVADRERSIAIGSFVADSPIILYRLMRFSDSVKTGADLVERVLGATRRVEWQLRRVYRLRNDITHVARFTGGDERLHEHLQLYVSSAVDTLAEVLTSDTGIETIEDAVAAIDGEFQQWLDRVRELGQLRAPTLDPTLTPKEAPSMPDTAARSVKPPAQAADSGMLAGDGAANRPNDAGGRKGKAKNESAAQVGSPAVWRDLYMPPYTALASAKSRES
jgi:hypothetical protein